MKPNKTNKSQNTTQWTNSTCVAQKTVEASLVKPPRRVAFFLWIEVWGKILTIANSSKRDFSLVGWCRLCRYSGEIMDHLLLHCDVFWQWSKVFQMFGVHQVMTPTVVSLLSSWRNWFGKYYSGIWNMVPFCLMWLVWKA